MLLCILFTEGKLYGSYWPDAIKNAITSANVDNDHPTPCHSVLTDMDPSTT